MSSPHPGQIQHPLTKHLLCDVLMKPSTLGMSERVVFDAPLICISYRHPIVPYRDQSLSRRCSAIESSNIDDVAEMSRSQHIAGPFVGRLARVITLRPHTDMTCPWRTAAKLRTCTVGYAEHGRVSGYGRLRQDTRNVIR